MAFNLQSFLQQAMQGGGNAPNAAGRTVTINGQQVPIQLIGEAGAQGSFAVGLNPATGQWEPLMIRDRDYGRQVWSNEAGNFVPYEGSQLSSTSTFDWGAPETWGLYEWAFGTPQLAEGVQKFSGQVSPYQVYQQGSHLNAFSADDSGNLMAPRSDLYVRQVPGSWTTDIFGNNVFDPNAGTRWEVVNNPWDGWGQAYGAVMGDRANQRSSLKEMLPVAAMIAPAFLGLAGFGAGAGTGVGAAEASASAGGTAGASGLEAAMAKAASDMGLTMEGAMNAGFNSAMSGATGGAVGAGIAGYGGSTGLSTGLGAATDAAFGFTAPPIANATTGAMGAFDAGMADYLGLSTPADQAAVQASLAPSPMGMEELLKYGEGALKLGGALHSMLMAEDMEDQMNAMMNNQNQVNWALVDQYLQNPMSLLNKNPGYLASVDFLTKEGKRKMAQQGYNASGNINYYLADVLGRNAQQWYKDLWNPVAQASGLSVYNPNAAAQIQTNAISQIHKTKQDALGDLGKAARDTLPQIFKFALG